MNPMKDSGVEWIGEIPRDWERNKLGFLGSLQNGISKSGDEFGFGLPFVSYGDVYNNFQLPITPSGLVNSTKNDRLLYSVKRGDVFFTRTSETADEIGIASTSLHDIIDATFSGFLIRFRPINGRLDPLFSKYYFRSDIGKMFMVREMNLVTRASLGQNLLKKFPVLLPPLQEQQAIANFLDEETKKLDDAKDLLQKQIEKLKAYRKSLIWETVTKGLEQTVPMKDSGVEWIGEIPVGWETQKIKYLTKYETSQYTTNDVVDINETGFPLYDAQRIIGYIEQCDRKEEYISIIKDGAGTGRVRINKSKSSVLATMGYIIPQSINLKFLFYVFSEIDFNYYIQGSTIPHIYFKEYGNLRIPVPPLTEQEKISTFLDEKTSVIEKIISNIESQIVNIDKQKKTLIYDYVTGKGRVI